MSPTDYMTVLEDLALKYRLNVAVAHGFQSMETPRKDGLNTKKFVDLWPIQMSAEVASDGRNVLTTNFDTYTLILQLGHILQSVRDWHHAYSLRVVVFVEYESEVDEEAARLKALLEKLRIRAQVVVLWLATGHLSTYELIVNGRTEDAEAENVVNDALKHEKWWDELQSYRGQTGEMTSSRETQQLAHILDSTAGRLGAYNPHDESGSNRRRHSVTEVTEMPKNPDISLLYKWGVNVGIHTHHLPENVFREPEPDDGVRTTAECSDSDEEEYGFDPEDVAAAEPGNPAKRPLLERAYGKSAECPSGILRRGRNFRSSEAGAPQPLTYGSISVDKGNGAASQCIPAVMETGASPPTVRDENPRVAVESFPALNASSEPPEPALDAPFRSRSPSPLKASQGRASGNGYVTPVRPNFSRQSSASRFSSRPVPETRVVAEEEGSKLSFAPAGPERAAPETHSSLSRHHSRTGSQYSVLGQGDVRLTIPELFASYKNDRGAGEDAGGGSTYSTQCAALSFNDLPSRAQHLILNELMLRNSKDTAVLMSTLPIPCEDTSLDEAATIRYLSDVEMLCRGLPPTMMVLSNSMTVTVSL